MAILPEKEVVMSNEMERQRKELTSMLENIENDKEIPLKKEKKQVTTFLENITKIKLSVKAEKSSKEKNFETKIEMRKKCEIF